MKLVIVRLLGVCAIAFVTAVAAQAQPFTGTYRPPQISPYLNIIGTNQQGVSNYFTQVLPQLQNQQSFQRQQAQLNRIQQDQNTLNNRPAATGTNPQGNPEIRATGHPTSYMTYSHYYQLAPAGRGR
ncbi:MAG: hypothetical protein QM811_24560 [Pirellulales bacterium]